jgi:hypothetical protein
MRSSAPVGAARRRVGKAAAGKVVADSRRSADTAGRADTVETADMAGMADTAAPAPGMSGGSTAAADHNVETCDATALPFRRARTGPDPRPVVPGAAHQLGAAGDVVQRAADRYDPHRHRHVVARATLPAPRALFQYYDAAPGEIPARASQYGLGLPRHFLRSRRRRRHVNLTRPATVVNIYLLYWRPP